MFEYKFLPAPRQVDRNGRLSHEGDGLAGSLDGEANLLAAAGWEFLRCDTVPVKRRRLVFFTTTCAQPVLIYRRPVREPAQPPATVPAAPVRPRRVTRTAAPASRTPFLLDRPTA